MFVRQVFVNGRLYSDHTGTDNKGHYSRNYDRDNISHYHTSNNDHHRYSRNNNRVDNGHQSRNTNRVYNGHTQTPEEKEREKSDAAAKIVKDLTVPTTNMSSTVRRKTCAQDSRPTATTVGLSITFKLSFTLKLSFTFTLTFKLSITFQ
nr:hypothetical protein BaRGS_020495 [Batillaria attramentaria]